MDLLESLGSGNWQSLANHDNSLYTINDTNNTLDLIDIDSGVSSQVLDLSSFTYTALASDGTNLYTIDNDSNSLYIIDISNDTTTLVGTVGSLGNKDWTGLTYDTTDNTLLALNNTDKRVESINVIDGTTSILNGSEISENVELEGLAYYNDLLYVLSSINGRLYPIGKIEQPLVEREIILNSGNTPENFEIVRNENNNRYYHVLVRINEVFEYNEQLTINISLNDVRGNQLQPELL